MARFNFGGEFTDQTLHASAKLTTEVNKIVVHILDSVLLHAESAVEDHTYGMGQYNMKFLNTRAQPAAHVSAHPDMRERDKVHATCGCGKVLSQFFITSIQVAF